MPELRDLSRFEYNEGAQMDINATLPDYQEVNNFTTSADLLPGLYAVVVNVKYTNSDKTNKSVWRLSTDGGATWSDPVYTEVKDTANVEIDEWIALVDHVGGAMNIIFEGSKTSSSIVVNVRKSIISIERKNT